MSKKTVEYLEIETVELDGVRYFKNPEGSFQCIDCLYRQPLRPFRDEDKLVIGMVLANEHSASCRYHKHE